MDFVRIHAIACLARLTLNCKVPVHFYLFALRQIGTSCFQSLAVRDVLESDKPFVVRILNQKGDVSFMDLCRPIEQCLGPFSLREHLVLRKLARYPEGDCERPVDYKQDEDPSDLSGKRKISHHS